MKKILIPILLVLLAVMLVSGCNNGCGDDCKCNAVQNQSTPTVTDTPTPVPVTDETAEEKSDEAEIMEITSRDCNLIAYEDADVAGFMFHVWDTSWVEIFPDRKRFTTYLCTLANDGTMNLYVQSTPSGEVCNILIDRQRLVPDLEETDENVYFIDWVSGLNVEYVTPFSRKVSEDDMARIKNLIEEIQALPNNEINADISDGCICYFQVIVREIVPELYNEILGECSTNVTYTYDYSTEDAPYNKLADIIGSYFPNVIKVLKYKDEETGFVLPKWSTSVNDEALRARGYVEE